VPRDPRQALGFLLGIWLAFALLLPLVARAEPSEDLERLEAHLHRAANDVRRRQHRIELRRDPALDRVARAHSADMAARGYLAHETPEGLSPLDRLERAAITGFTLAAENAGRTDRSDPVREIVEGWQLSSEHRRNLLAPAFNTTGVGAARAADGSLYFTQLYVAFPRAPGSPISGR
jgi:uncharacterized protein YkwD